MTHAFATLAALLASAPSAEPDSTIKVDAGKVVNRISPLMYGSCIEDVNHEIYGGLYAQMIFGESFEEPPSGAGPAWAGRRSAATGRRRTGPCPSGPTRGQGRRARPRRRRRRRSRARSGCATPRGDNAGLILRVREPRVGAGHLGRLRGQPLARNQNVMLGRHRNDFQCSSRPPPRSSPAVASPPRRDWQGATSGSSSTTPRSRPSPSTTRSRSPPAGVGVRTWDSDAAFRNLVIEPGRARRSRSRFEPRRRPEPTRGLSGMWDLVRTGDAVAS